MNSLEPSITYIYLLSNVNSYEPQYLVEYFSDSVTLKNSFVNPNINSATSSQFIPSLCEEPSAEYQLIRSNLEPVSSDPYKFFADSKFLSVPKVPIGIALLNY